MGCNDCVLDFGIQVYSLKMDTYPEIGYTPANLRFWIARNNLLQKDVASILGVSDNAVRKWLMELDKPSHRDMPLEMWRKLLSWQPENQSS